MMVLVIIYDGGMISLQQHFAARRMKNHTKINETMFGFNQLQNVSRISAALKMKSHLQLKISEEIHKESAVTPHLALPSIGIAQNVLYDNDWLESSPKVALPSFVRKAQNVLHGSGKLQSRPKLPLHFFVRKRQNELHHYDRPESNPKVVLPSFLRKAQNVLHDSGKLQSRPEQLLHSFVRKTQSVLHDSDKLESSHVIAGQQRKIKAFNRPHRIGVRPRLSSDERKDTANEKHSKHEIQFHTQHRPKLDQKCPGWKLNKQDWTLVYHGSMEKYNSNCPKPYIGSNIKRVSFKDGSYINTGCTNRTYECKEKPFYDFKAGERINTPPCCRHHVIQMLQHVTKELKRWEIKHSMISGGIIGWVRDKKMVPYDRDLDIILEEDFWNTTEFWNMFRKLNERYGYVYDLVEDFKLKLYFSKINRISLDIWMYWIEDEELAIAYHGFKSQKVQVMLPFKYVQFEWFYTYIPNKPRDYLNTQYGRERWETEKRCMVKDAEGDCW